MVALLREKLIEAIIETTITEHHCVFEFENDVQKHFSTNCTRITAYKGEAKVADVWKDCTGEETVLFEDDIEMFSMDELYDIAIHMDIL